MNQNGKIVKALSGFYYVLTTDGQRIECRARGIFRKEHITPLVGDEVTISLERGKGMVETVLPRRNSFVRPAANLTSIHIYQPPTPYLISYTVFCLKKQIHLTHIGCGQIHLYHLGHQALLHVCGPPLR
ncbi:MAG: hypothetical protein CW335_06985, partial [Clostridiales bacterium]|nr:hypothetical protein [Clostridiales bacterium]